MTGNNLNSPPDVQEIEISIFGTGYGECILLHIGNNKWFVVDSCIDPLTKTPAPLAYLNQIGVNPVESVRQIMASHWHDDHIKGLGEIVKTCVNAQFICSGAMERKEAREIIRTYGRRSLMESSGIDELRIILDELMERGRNRGERYVAPKLAFADRLLWKGDEGSIYALSPSDASIIASQADFASLFPEEMKPKRRLLSSSPNHSSVVIWAEVGDINILFGSDLEETGDSNRGWSVVVESGIPNGKASFFKIPHHGSEGAHYSNVWDAMLKDNPTAVLTPFEKGSIRLPSVDDVNRICSLTDDAYSTGTVGRRRTIKRDKTVEKTIREVALNIRELTSSYGHIRLRAQNSDDWNVELFGEACDLQKLSEAS